MLINKQKPRNKQPNKDHLHLIFFWLAGWYLVPEEFKERMRINRETFDFILEWIAQLIHKDPTYIASNPIQDHRQLGLTIYRLTHGCLFKVIMEIFGFPIFWLQRHLIMSFNAWYSPYTMNLFAYKEQKQTGQTNVKVS